MISKNDLIPMTFLVGYLPMTAAQDQPIFLRRKGQGWYIHSGELYLGADTMGIEDYEGRPPDFFYKNGTTFDSIEKALETLNAADIKHKMKIKKG